MSPNLTAEMVCAALEALHCEVAPDSTEQRTIFRVKGSAMDFASAMRACGIRATAKNETVTLEHSREFVFAEAIATVAALEQGLAVVRRPMHIEFGPGLRAAQEIFARAQARGVNA